MSVSLSYENMESERKCFAITKCCFCIPLRTGCLILGYISLILNLLINLFFAGSIIIMAFITHGFRYIHLRQTQTGDVVPYEREADKTKLHLAITLILLVGCLNVAWLTISAFLLIGLHKKRRGPIKAHITFATIRLLLSVAGLVSVPTSKATMFCWIEICMSAYFSMIYYAYTRQLEYNQRAKEIKETQNTVADIVFSYHNNIDKQSLTEKNNIKNLSV